MTFQYTNKANIDLPLAVFLMMDKYDYDARPNVISATSLIKPIRQIVLARQNMALDKQVDILDLVSSRMGSAIHDACEDAWTDPQNIMDACEVLGVNPTKLNISAEVRHEKAIGNYIISGKYDLVLNGHLSDYKSTSVWSYIYNSNAAQYSKQGSIYKWLAPDIITDDTMSIQYIFTDWSSTKARQDSSYPQMRVATKEYPLNSVEETHQWVNNKLAHIDSLMESSQDDMPRCSDEELWASETVWKYYKNPNSRSRATKNFTSEAEAQARWSNDGGVGVIVEHKGQVKACQYCSVVDICEQANELLAEGRLML